MCHLSVTTVNVSLLILVSLLWPMCYIPMPRAMRSASQRLLSFTNACDTVRQYILNMEQMVLFKC